MKKILFATIFLGGIAIVSNAHTISNPTPYCIKMTEWEKSKTQTWAGNIEGKTYWYKLDKSAKLWWSTDGKKWAKVESQSWTDKDGKWLKIHEAKLVWSTDGNSWSEVPEWKWEGSDGKWNKFDKNWMLWTNK